jgi:glucokinase
MKTFYVGVDVGGSHIEVGLIDDNGKILESKGTDIQGSEITPKEVIQLIKESVELLTKKLSKAEDWKLVSCGIGCPGTVKGDILIAASNFPKFGNVPFVKMMSEALGGIPVALLNDADAAVCAEVWGNPTVYGKFQSVAMLTLGTGIGCGLILDGHAFHGSHGMIEAGHMIVSTFANSRPCGCGQKGCCEVYSSAGNIVKSLQELDLKDGNTTNPVTDGKDVFQRYLMNDYNAVKVVEEVSFIYLFVYLSKKLIFFFSLLDRRQNIWLF